MKVTVIMPVKLLNDELKTLTNQALVSFENTANKELMDIVLVHNKGYPEAINYGATKAKGEYFAIANNDIRVMSNWISVAETIFNEDKNVGSVHFRMIDYETPMKGGYSTYLEGKERWCNASFFVIRKKAFVWYDERYGMGGYDDYDFFHRLRHINGWKTAYTTLSCYQHKHSSTLKALDDGKSRALQDKKNLELFIKKWGKEPDKLFSELYPEQWSQDYYSFYNVL